MEILARWTPRGPFVETRGEGWGLEILARGIFWGKTGKCYGGGMSRGEHLELCVMGAKWLRARGCTVVLVDPQTNRTAEQPDVIGWRYGFWSLLIEVKTSRGDFVADLKKLHRQPGAVHMGQERWYLAPAGLLKAGDLPAGWGLLEVVQGPRGPRLKEVVKAGRPRGFRSWATADMVAYREEVPLLMAELERVMAGRPTHLLPQGKPSTRQKRAEKRRAKRGCGPGTLVYSGGMDDYSEVPVKTELTVVPGDTEARALNWKVYETRGAGVREPVDVMALGGPQNPLAEGEVPAERDLVVGQWVYVPSLLGGYHGMRVTVVSPAGGSAEDEGWLAVLARDTEEVVPGLPRVWRCTAMINRRCVQQLGVTG